MTRIKLLLNMLAVFVVCLACGSMAQAQATRTWASGVGDDVNPCSRTAPCKTFGGTISKTAAGGEIDALDPAGYGAVTITKSLTIDGGTGSGWASILASLTNGIIINAGANDVVILRHLSINGVNKTNGPGLSGIRFLAGQALHVESSQIFGFNNFGIEVNKTAAADVRVIDTTISEIRGGAPSGGPAGIFLKTTVGNISASLTNVQITRCITGIEVQNNAIASVTMSGLTNNTTGLNLLTGGAGLANVDRTLISSNQTGINVGTGTNARISDNTIVQNSTGVNNGGTTTTTQDNKFIGNTNDSLGNALAPILKK